jgi:hypothetical protein
MKTTTTTTASVRKADASLDAKLNPVELSSKEVVSWGIAFPRSEPGASRRSAEAGTSTPTEIPHPTWRTDATVGSVLGVLGRMSGPAATDGRIGATLTR